jgi:long-chain acyl-CoA synthetase
MSLNLAHLLDLNARARPEGVAIQYGGERFTYAWLRDRMLRVAGLLRSKGLGRGDKVALRMPNVPDFTAVFFGALAAGTTAVPLNPDSHPQEFGYFLRECGAKALFVGGRGAADGAHALRQASSCRHAFASDGESPAGAGPAQDLDEALAASPAFSEVAHVSACDTAAILYSSGTTGRPKGAELSHVNLFQNAVSMRDQVVRATPEDVFLAVLPLFHCFGLTCVQNTALFAGASVTLLPEFNPGTAVELIRDHGVTVMPAAPTMLFHILAAAHEEPQAMRGLRLILSGGAALPVEVLKAFDEFYGVPVLEGYGLSETSPVASFHHAGQPVKPGSIGVPVWGCEMKVVGNDGRRLAPGEVGEIAIRGHNVMKGYYQQPEATAEATRDGWFYTGDLGRMDEDGYFYVAGRKKDLIIRAGMNIYPRDIEEVLHRHPDVMEAAVIGVPDRILGEEVKAYAVLREGSGADRRALTDHCLRHLAPYMCPKRIQIAEALPKGPTGKVLKRELREMHEREMKESPFA